MLQVMRDEEAETSRRDEMAKAAAPFLHSRLAAVEHKRTLPDLAMSFSRITVLSFAVISVAILPVAPVVTFSESCVVWRS